MSSSPSLPCLVAWHPSPNVQLQRQRTNPSQRSRRTAGPLIGLLGSWFLVQPTEQGLNSTSKPQESAEKAQPAPKNPGKTRNKRAVGTTPSTSNHQSEASEATTKKRRTDVANDGNGGGGGDSELIEKFQAMFADCILLTGVTSSDEQAFGQWSREKLKTIQDARSQMYTKKKSLKRRSSQMSEDVGSALDEFMNNLSRVADLVKKISVGCPEGRHVYEALSSLCEELHVEVSPAVWMRALRAMAFDNLKTKAWKEFFVDTWTLCLQHLPSESGFFNLVTSQLLQRLIKAISTAKGVTQESLAVVRSFVEAMAEQQNIEKTLPRDMSLDDHSRMVNSVKIVLDFNSSPSTVQAAIEEIKQNVEQHWAAGPFELGHGKKIIETALANSKTKESVAGVLDMIGEAATLVSLKAAFSQDHGAQVTAYLRKLHDKPVKCLRGADRDKLLRVQKTAKQAVLAIVFGCLNNELLPYLNELSRCLSAKETCASTMLPSSCCIMQLADDCGQYCSNGEGMVLNKLKDLSEFASTLAEKCSAESVPEAEASALSSQWKTKAWIFNRTLDICATKATAAAPDGEDATRMASILTTVQSSCDTVSSAIDIALRGHVKDKAMSNIDELIKTVVAVVSNVDGPGPTAEDTTNFFAKIEAAKLASTVLGEDGATVRNGTEALALLYTCLTSSVSARDREPNTVIEEKIIVDFIMSCNKLVDMDYSDAWAKLNSVTTVVSDEALAILTQSATTMRDLRDTEFTTLSTAIKEHLDGAAIDESTVEIHDGIYAIESFDDIAKTKDSLTDVHFSMSKTTEVSTQATKLEEAIRHAKEIASGMGMKVEDVVPNLVNHETSYRSALKWLVTGNMLYSLTSKAVRRALQTQTKPNGKAITSLKDALAAAADNNLEVPVSLQALASKIIQFDVKAEAQANAAQ
ncbi:unnamed protein product [Symbiodinium sp. CCMP2592]|nr:unnamed protein product [Symbiodinium sp. CCMP2592]